jgi:hypothetical protein
MFKRAVALLAAWMTGCGGGEWLQPPLGAEPVVPRAPLTVTIPSQALWGGDVRCMHSGCYLFAVEHSDNAAVLYRLTREGAQLLDRQPVAFHPDGARWLDDRWAVAAVEGSNSLDLFAVDVPRLRLQQRIEIGFPPRNVFAWSLGEGQWLLLGLPYSGDQVAWVQWSRSTGQAQVHRVRWCERPWFVAAQGATKGVTVSLPDRLFVACYFDKAVAMVDLRGVRSARDASERPPLVKQTFPYHVYAVGADRERQAVFATQDMGSQAWWYDSSTDGFSVRTHGLPGTLSVTPRDRDTVAWGWRDGVVRLVRYARDGSVAGSRDLLAPGFPTTLHWVDIDGNGHDDLVVLHSSDHPSLIYFDVELP